MRTARIVEDGAAYYHVMTRVVERRRVFTETWLLEAVRRIMRAVEGFRVRVTANYPLPTGGKCGILKPLFCG